MVHRACKRGVRGEWRKRGPPGKVWGRRNGDGGRMGEGRPAGERREGSGSRSEGTGSSKAGDGRRQAARHVSMENGNKVI